MKCRIALAFLALLSTGRVSMAQVSRSNSTTPNAPAIVRMTLHPVATTRPVLQYALLPEATQMTPGEATFLYGMASSIGASSNEKLDQLMNKNYSEIPLHDLPGSGLASDLAQFPNRLRFTDLAARREQANWDTTLKQDGVSALLPYISDLRKDAMLVGWRARLELAKHDWNAANYSLQSGLSMTLQLDHQAVLVQGLVACGISAIMLDRIEEWVAEPGAPNLYWSIGNLPQPFFDLRPMQQTERALIYYTIPELNQPDPLAITAEQWRHVAANIHQLTDFRPGHLSGVESQVGRALLAASLMPQAKQRLLSMGIPQTRIDAMSVDQTVGIYFLMRYRELSDECYKAWELPYWEGHTALERAVKDVEEERKATQNPLLVLPPSVERGRLQFARVDRQIGALRVIEALRDYAAQHDNQPPASLDQIVDLPLPIDPITGKPFSYECHGQSAVINAPGTPSGPGVRYELTFAR